jgi:hypothetical protein
MTGAITIRRSTVADGPEIVRLAELDSRAAPKGEALLALVDGELLAAVGVADGHAVADPFELTADVVELLRMRAVQERDGGRAGGPAALLSKLVPAWRGEVGRA